MHCAAFVCLVSCFPKRWSDGSKTLLDFLIHDPVEVWPVNNFRVKGISFGILFSLRGVLQLQREFARDFAIEALFYDQLI